MIGVLGGNGPRISKEVGAAETRSLDSAGLVGDALAKFGTTLVDVADSRSKTNKRLKDAVAANDAKNAQIRLNSEISKLERTSKHDARDTNHEKYSENYNKAARKIYENISSGLSVNANEKFDDATRISFNHHLDSTPSYEQNQQVLFLRDTIGKDIVTLEQAARTDGDDVNSAANFDVFNKNLNAYVATGVITKVEAEEHSRKAAKKIATSLVEYHAGENMDTFTSMSDEEAKEAMNSYFSKDRKVGSSLTKSLLPGDAKDLTEKLHRLYTKETNKKSEGEVFRFGQNEDKLNKNITGYNGVSLVPPKAILEVMGKNVANMSAKDQEKYAPKLDKAIRDFKATEKISDMPNKELLEMETRVRRMYDKGYVSPEDAEAQLRAIKNEKTLREKGDSFEVATRNRNFNGDRVKVAKWQEERGQPIRTKSDADAKILVQAINELPTVEGKLQFLGEQLASEGDYKKEALAHLIEQGLSPTYMAAFSIASPNVSQSIIKYANKDEQKALDNDFKARYTTAESDILSLSAKKAVNKAASDIFFQGKSHLVAGLYGAMTNRMKELMIEGKTNSEAVEQAEKEIITNNFYKYELNGNSYIVPKMDIGASDDDLKLFTKNADNVEVLKTLKIKIPATSFQKGNNYLETLADDITWVPTDDGTGVQLMAPNTRTKETDEKGFGAVYSEDGKKVIVPWGELKNTFRVKSIPTARVLGNKLGVH